MTTNWIVKAKKKKEKKTQTIKKKNFARTFAYHFPVLSFPRSRSQNTTGTSHTLDLSLPNPVRSKQQTNTSYFLMALTLALTRQNLASFVNRIPQPFSTAERLRRFLGGSATISESEGTPTPSSCSSVHSETPTVIDQPVSLYHRKYRIADLRQLLPNHDEVRKNDTCHVQTITELVRNPTTPLCNEHSNTTTTTTTSSQTNTTTSSSSTATTTTTTNTTANQPTNITPSPAPVRIKPKHPPHFKINSLTNDIQPKSTDLVQNAPKLSLGQSRLYQKRMKKKQNYKTPPSLTVNVDDKPKPSRDAASLISAFERKLDLHPLRA